MKKMYTWIIVLIILVFSTIQILNIYTYNYIDQGYIKASIKVDKDTCNKDKSNKSNFCQYKYYPGTYSFSKKFVQQLKNSDEITAVYPSSYKSSTYDYDTTKHDTLNLALVLDNANSTLTLRPSQIGYTFKTFQMPRKYLEKTGTINKTYYGIDLVKEKTNNTKYQSIYIPDNLSLIKDIDVGQIVKLPVVNKSGIPFEQKYFVAGIYDTTYVPVTYQNVIYLDYDANHNPKYNEEEIYDEISHSPLSSDPDQEEYLQNEQNFISKNSPFITTINIFSNDVSNTVEKIQKEYPYATIQTSRSNNSYSKLQNYTLVFFIIILIIIIVVLISCHKKIKNNCKLTSLEIIKSYFYSVFWLIFTTFTLKFSFKIVNGYTYNINYLYMFIGILIFTFISFVLYIIFKKE